LDNLPPGFQRWAEFITDCGIPSQSWAWLCDCSQLYGEMRPAEPRLPKTCWSRDCKGWRLNWEELEAKGRLYMQVCGWLNR
jgi:hypothetical protein